MIRLIQRRLIIPRGDTGSFSIPVLSKGVTDNIAVFTIFDETTHTKMFQKMVPSEGDVINIAFTHNDTVNLKPGKYVWDIKYYSNPEFVDEELVNGEEIDSYYAGFSLPVCEIRETADNYLVSPDAPNATLSPSQLDIITSAINDLNEAIRKTGENVEHYPEIRNDVWYVWDAEQGDYVSTNVPANGVAGNGIESAVLNNDYTLTLNFTDGTSFTSSSIRGETGNGIDDIVLNNDFTLTISYTDGESYTTPSIRGPIGLTPQFSIGNVQDGAVAAASITGTAENPVLNLTLPNAHVPTRVSQLENDAGYLTQHQDLSDYVQKTDYATNSNAGIVKGGSRGVMISDNGTLTIDAAISEIIKIGTNGKNPIVPGHQHESTFYGLAKAAGDTTQSQSSNAVGTYTNEAKAAIQTMLDVPSNGEMNTAIGTAIGQINSFDMAVVQTLPTQDISTHTIYLVPKTGETNDVYDEYVYINNNWEMVGNTQIDLSDYALKSELPDVPVQDVQVNGVSILDVQGVAEIPLAGKTTEGVIKVKNADVQEAITNGGSVLINGVLFHVGTSNEYALKTGTDQAALISTAYQHASTFYGLAKAAGIAGTSAGNEVGTYTETAKTAIRTMLGAGDITDIQVNGTSVVQDGVANIQPQNGYGIGVDANDKSKIVLIEATDLELKGGGGHRALTGTNQHKAVFYGLAKASGDTTQSQSNNAVGTYTDDAKTAIKTMLGVQDGLKVVRLI